MKNIQIFLLVLILNCTFLIGEASAQWWSSGGNLSWPYGTVNMKNMIVSDDYNKAKAYMTDQGYRITGLFFKTAQNWQPALRSQYQIDDESFTGTSNPYSFISALEFKMTSGVQNGGTGTQTSIRNFTSGSFSWHTNPSWNLLVVSDNNYASFSPKGKIQNLLGVYSYITSESGSADTVLNWYSFRSGINQWSPGSTKVDNFYSFYSKNDKPSMVYGKFYHFYGVGDYNSYFGGSITQKVYTTNVSNPPTAAELNSAFPNAVEGETIYIDDNNAGTNFYQVVKEGTNWWIFTGTKAL